MPIRIPEYSTQFQRDVKRAQRRGKDIAKLKDLLAILIAGQPLLPRHKDHALKNNWSGYRDAHIEPDWLLIYCIEDGVIRFERTGSHSDLFD
jgi:mRNA interferase YafQ